MSGHKEWRVVHFEDGEQLDQFVTEYFDDAQANLDWNTCRENGCYLESRTVGDWERIPASDPKTSPALDPRQT